MIGAATPAQRTNKARWRNFYAHAVEMHLQNAIRLINKKKASPQALQGHFDSFLNLAEQAAKHPSKDTRRKFLVFVEALHPLPVWWGKFDAWMPLLAQGIYIARESGEVEKEIWIYLAQSKMLLASGNGEKALQQAEKAAALAATAPNHKQLFQAKAVLFEAKRYLGTLKDQTQALNTLEADLFKVQKELPEKEGQEIEIIISLIKIDVIRRQGYVDEAAQLAAKTHEIAQTLFSANDLRMTKIYNALSTVTWAQRKHTQAIAYRKKSISTYRQWGNTPAEVEEKAGLGLIYWSAERYREAEKTFLENIALAEDYNLLWLQAMQIGNLGLVHFSCGRLNQARLRMEQHYTLSKLIRNRPETRRAQGNLGTIQTHLGDFENALENMLDDYKQAKKRQLIQPQATLNAKLAWALQGVGQQEEALRRAKKSLTLAKEINDPLVKSMALRCLSEVAHKKVEQIRYAEEARQLARQHHRRLSEAGALLTLSHLKDDPSLHQDAVNLLKEIGATAWLKVKPVFSHLRLPLLL